MGKRYATQKIKTIATTDDQKDDKVASKMEEYSKNENLQSTKPKKKKGRTRSYSDLTVSKSDIFEDEMAKIIMDAFPGILQDDKKKDTEGDQDGKGGDGDKTNGANGQGP